MKKTTVAHLRRTLTPGTRIRITNYVRPAGSRDTRVHEKTNTVDLVTWGINTLTGEQVGTHTAWPKAADLRPGDTETVFHIDQAGKPFLTVEVIGDEHPEATTWPTTVRTR